MVLLFAIAIVDAKEKRIPNKLLFGFLACVVLCFIWRGTVDIADILLGSVSVSGFLLFVMWLKPGAFGAGDVKLMAISGLFLGFEKNVTAFVVGVLLAGMFCLAGISLKKIGRKTEIPFGPFLCAGIAVAMFFT